ncbi:hypothetical protein J7394_13795 [Ruegeria sp. R13_0]|uniref:tetratricopeptide repeat protein n=1 Tax=Ruegeria sp. R13_0 TaxID=2821099 RepID=UPI001AD9B9D9|nr:hypothetical protein [Ruegeria sp. R13_0]MBO9435285.1 hypothetical protein [Ruegeria sp. R13_0]
MLAEVSSAIDPRAIQEQLKRILVSPHFADTTRLNRFLSHIVDEALAGRSETLKGYAIGIDVFDKPEDFDPTIDTIVRVQANKMRSRLDLYYAQEGREDPVRIHIPKGSYAPVFEIAFDPERRADASPPPATTSRVAVAVMPFDNLSGDPSQEYLADGFTEEVISAIARFREVSVLSRHVTFRFRGRGRDPRAVGSELDVQYLVEGSVRHWNDKLRVTAQLIDAETGQQVSTDTYDRDLSADSLFEIQDDIAARIATEIAEPHGVIHRTGAVQRSAQTHTLDAYQCRLLASEYWREPTAEKHKKVRDLLERAVEIDPEYAGAWGMLAIVYGDEVRGGFNFRKSPPPFDRALEAAQRSVALDPLNATGQHALFLTHFHRGEFESFEEAAAKALRANPNYPDMLADLAACFALRGDLEQAARLSARAIELSPNPPGWYHASTFLICFINGDYSGARSAARKVGGGMWNGSEVLELMCVPYTEPDADLNSALLALKTKIPDVDRFIRTLYTIWHVPSDISDQMTEALRTSGALD